MTDAELAANHDFVRQSVGAGNIADFTKAAGYRADTKPKIGAEFLRHLMLGLDSAKPRLPGVRIKGARLIGKLDLSDCAGASGAGLPALALEDCDLPERLDLSGARVARLSILGSKFSDIWGVGLRVDGDLDLTQAKPAPREIGGDGTSYIRLRAARIGGDVWARGIELRSPRRFVEGLDIFPDALGLQSATIDGNVMIDEGAVIRGCTWLLGAKIGGAVQFSGSQFLNPVQDGQSPDDARGAIVLTGAMVGGTIYFRASGERRFEAHGGVELGAARIAGNIYCDGARMVGDQAFSAQGAVIGGDVFFNSMGDFKFEAKGEVSLRACRIEGGVFCDTGKFLNRGGQAFTLSGASIAKAMLLNDGFRAEGSVQMDSLTVHGSIMIHDAKIDGALDAKNLDVRGDLAFGGVPPEGSKYAFEADGQVSLWGARINGDLSVINCRLGATDTFALRLDYVRIAGEFRMSANNLQIGASLSGARIERLIDDPARGWGDKDEAPFITLNEITIDLIGKSEGVPGKLWKQRTRWLKRNSPNLKLDNSASGRAAARQIKERFHNQPWRQVAAAYDRAGLHADARRVRREEQREANRRRPWWQAPFVWLFAEFMFGFGLSVTRATVSVMVLWAIGFVGVTLMDIRGALIDSETSLACTRVQPALYAADVMIPVLDLQQEKLCEPGKAPGAALSPGIAELVPGKLVFEEVALWRWAKALYAIAGAVVVGFAILTWTGVFKPKASG